MRSIAVQTMHVQTMHEEQKCVVERLPEDVIEETVVLSVHRQQRRPCLRDRAAPTSMRHGLTNV